jgi:probable F420-dependent oxidoreductase
LGLLADLRRPSVENPGKHPRVRPKREGAKVRFAVVLPVGGGKLADPDWVVAYAVHAEALGFESLVAVEHAVIISDHASKYPYTRSGRFPLAQDCAIPDPLELLSFLAASTSSIGLATGVLILPEHHPVVMAKRLATLDRLSGGRLRLCIGNGWMREELEACGTDFETRGRRMDESIDVLRLLWGPDGPHGASHHGEFFDFDGALSNPKPVRGSIPVHIGGHSDAAARRAGLRGDGFQPLGLQGVDLEKKLAVMRTAATEAGRNPDALELSLGGPLVTTGPEQVAEATDLRAVRFVGLASSLSDLDEARGELSSFMERVGSSEKGTGRG